MSDQTPKATMKPHELVSLCLACMDVLAAYMYTTFVPVGSPEVGSVDGADLPYGCWEMNPGPLQEKEVFLSAELSLHPHHVT